MSHPQFEREPAEGGLDVVEHELARQAGQVPATKARRPIAGPRSSAFRARGTELLIISMAVAALVVAWRLRRPS